MNQEPGTDAEIKAFAQTTYGAEFPMFSKIDVNGPETHPVYRFLRTKSALWNAAKNEAEVIPWSWTKFLVNEAGEVVHYHVPRD